MPSPFPGMDPYLEAPEIWPDFQAALALAISQSLSETLPAGYEARLNRRTEPATLPEGEPTGYAFVEIGQHQGGDRPQTLIEIVGPRCKRPGADREAYIGQQREALSGGTSLITIDLLRDGRHPWVSDEFGTRLESIGLRPDYLVLVNRAWQPARGVARCQVFPTFLPEPLPAVPVPLREGQAEALLDLQFVFTRAYDGGPYRRGAVDYTQPPRPPLPDHLVGWARERIRAAGLTAG
jgi:hypothetical protein